MDTQKSPETRSEGDNNKKVKKEESWWDIIRFAIITLAIIIPVRMYVAQPFIVSGESMFPTFHDNEYLIVDEFSYHFNTPERGDVVIFRYPNDPSKFFVKRIIGLPGETVMVSGGKVYITKDGEQAELNEPYLKQQTFKNTVTKLAEEQYFVMGDNRAVSFDSRYWGPVNIKFIRGKALVRLFPPNQISYKPGSFSNYQLDK